MLLLVKIIKTGCIYATLVKMDQKIATIFMSLNCGTIIFGYLHGHNLCKVKRNKFSGTSGPAIQKWCLRVWHDTCDACDRHRMWKTTIYNFPIPSKNIFQERKKYYNYFSAAVIG